MSAYLSALRAEQFIDADEHAALAPTGVQSAEELYALTLHFPALLAQALPQGHLAKISALAAQRTSLSFRNAAVARLNAPVPFAKGARHPPNAPYPPGARVAFKAAATAGTVKPPPRIDHHSAWRSAGWTVRDQGERGTCVAHAIAAAKEALAFDAATATPAALDESEQFLFWGAKQFDPSHADGTLHGYALQSLRQHGVCEESGWPYVPRPLAGGTVHQGPPPAPALSAAASRLHAGGGVAAPANAIELYRRLRKGAVTIGVPVFADPANPLKDNWNVGGLMEYGRVMDPPPLSVVIGGHAVCVLGFEPDEQELSGHGWFILRNSWGTSDWGSRLPVAGYRAPEPGYGQISWAYVDSYLWEMCWLA